MNKILSKTKKQGSKNAAAAAAASVGNGAGVSAGGGTSIDLGTRPTLASQPITLNLPPTNSTTSNHSTSGSNSSLFSSLTDFNKFGSVGKSLGKDKKKKIDKSQISGPTGFKVVQHVGLSTSSNIFEVTNNYLTKNVF